MLQDTQWFVEIGSAAPALLGPPDRRAALIPSAVSEPDVTDLAGMRVMVVEDEFFMALFIEDVLRSFGCVVIGPVASLAEAMEVVSREELDAAILDVNLRGQMVYPLAEHLLEQGKPFVFSTGYALSDMPERFRSVRRLGKPFDIATLRSEIENMR